MKRTNIIRCLTLVIGTTWVVIGATPGAVRGQSTDVALSGEVRVRYELDDRTQDVDPDGAALLRTRLGAFVTFSPRARAFVQLSDSRVFGEETNTLTDASADRLDLHQGYVEFEPLDSVWLRAGRQELAFADERLIGPVGWANVTRAFDGLRAHGRLGGWSLDVFATTLRERDAVLATGLDPRENQGEDDDRRFFGAWGSTGPVDLFVLYDRDAEEPTFTNVDRYTLGGYGRAQAGGLSGVVTAAVQLGEQTPTGAERQDIEAFLLSGQVGGRWPGRAGLGWGVQVDYLSGDRSPDDGTHGAFNTLYATNHPFYGFMDFFLDPPRQTGFLGLVDIIVRGTADVRGGSLRLDLHHLRLAKENAEGDNAIGWEADLTASYPVADGVDLQAGYSLFHPGDAGKVAPVSLGDGPLHWAYVQGTARF